MNGYLERLTRSVMQPSQRVHPMVGSVFAPESHNLRTEAGATLEISQTAAAQQEDVEERRQLRDEVSLPKNAAIRGVHEQPPIEDRHFTPVVPKPMEANAPHAPVHVIKPLSLPGTKLETATEREFTPLMPPVREQHAETLGKPPAAASQRRRTDSENQRAAALEPDEIQIHIGRVEVVAVPQTQMPVFPKTVRKTPSLDEYLRRRDGRSL